MHNEIAAVFFDMGSTLSLQNPTREELLSDFLGQQGYKRSLHDVRRALMNADVWWHRWAEEVPFGWRNKETLQALRQKYRDAFLDALDLGSHDGLQEALADLFRTSIMRRHNALFPDVPPTLNALRAAGLRLAIVSNWDDSLTSHCDDLGLTPFFETIVGSLAVGYEKPDPRIFQAALDRLGLSAHQVIHVGDIYPSDVVGARRAGITPVLIDRYDLQPEADCLRVHSLTDIVPLVSASH
jgi:HAD superfamily hydrolase (TIGR01509 family)